MMLEHRPLSIGEIFDRAVQLYRSHFLVFLGIGLLPITIHHSLLLAGDAVARHLGHTGVRSTLIATFLPLLARLVDVGLTGVSLAAVNRAVYGVYLGDRPNIAASYSQVKPSWMHFIRLRLQAMVYAWGPVLAGAIVLGFALGLIGVILPGHHSQALGFVVIFIGLAGLAIGLCWGIRYAFCVPASISENLNIRDSLQRSVTLTGNGRGRISVMVLMYFVIAFSLSYALDVPFRLLGIVPWNPGGSGSLLAAVLVRLSSFLVNSLMAPLYGIAITLFYYDERIRKEGLDIEWMMERANLSPEIAPLPPPASPTVATMPSSIAIG